MTFKSEQKMSHGDMVWGGALQIKGLARIIGFIMFSAVFLNSIQAFSAPVLRGSSVIMAWTPSPDANIAGYNIYYGVASQTYTEMISTGNLTNATVSGLVAGVTYYFAATAYDDLGQESDYSDEISYLVPKGLPAMQIQTVNGGDFTLTVIGLAGRTYDIEATPDFLAWTVIGTITLDAGGSLDFTDTNAANFPQRFYRAALKP
jgi:hypothetical protein